MKSLKTDIFLREEDVFRGIDCGIARCPDILSFHAALNRFFRRGYEFVGEMHPFYELVYVVSGKVGITAGDEVYVVGEGHLLLHPPQEFHRIWSEQDTEPHLLNLSFFAAAMPHFSGRVLQPSPKDGKLLMQICEGVRRGLRNLDGNLLNEQRLQLELMLLRIAEKGDAGVSKSASFSAMRYAEAVNVLQRYLRESLDTNQIAKLCNMSVSSLKKIFTRYAGMGVSRYFTELKIHHAVILLRSGKRVSEAAESIGFTDQNYFSTVFRRVMGAPPSAFRPASAGVERKNLNYKNHIKTKEKDDMKFFTVENYDKLSRQAANIISAQVIMKPNSVLGLATGSSPLGTYRQLIDWYNKGDLDFSQVTSINLDEYVGLDEENDQSYRYFMQHNFFNHINIKRENTFVPNGCAEDPDRECAEYDARIERVGGIDLQLLGIGLDGHIGFNEPADIFVKATHVVDLHESTIRANARFFENENQVPKQAITMGMVSIMQAKKVLLIANGKAKKEIVEKAFFGPITPMIPASILQLHPDLTVIYSEE